MPPIHGIDIFFTYMYFTIHFFNQIERDPLQLRRRRKPLQLRFFEIMMKIFEKCKRKKFVNN